MLIVFVSVFIIILKLISQNIRVEKDNSRYAINSESSRTLIFEYDFGHKEIEFTGNSDFIFGENLKKLPLSEVSKIEDRIHEDERALFKHLREFVRSGGDSYNSELRLIEEDGKYAWYRISGSLISSEDGKPLKFIGNIVNVNAQVIHEQELKVLAQTDLLSGLLNKMYTEKSIDKFMAMNPD
ncbi:MAG: PAS domain-containing protein [Treponema sp.]|nr:PAS domain-containing protein [Treponema sp.]